MNWSRKRIIGLVFSVLSLLSALTGTVLIALRDVHMALVFALVSVTFLVGGMVLAWIPRLVNYRLKVVNVNGQRKLRNVRTCLSPSVDSLRCPFVAAGSWLILLYVFFCFCNVLWPNLLWNILLVLCLVLGLATFLAFGIISAIDENRQMKGGAND